MFRFCLTVDLPLYDWNLFICSYLDTVMTMKCISRPHIHTLIDRRSVLFSWNHTFLLFVRDVTQRKYIKATVTADAIKNKSGSSYMVIVNMLRLKESWLFLQFHKACWHKLNMLIRCRIYWLRDLQNRCQPFPNPYTHAHAHPSGLSEGFYMP